MNPEDFLNPNFMDFYNQNPQSNSPNGGAFSFGKTDFTSPQISSFLKQENFNANNFNSGFPFNVPRNNPSNYFTQMNSNQGLAQNPQDYLDLQFDNAFGTNNSVQNQTTNSFFSPPNADLGNLDMSWLDGTKVGLGAVQAFLGYQTGQDQLKLGNDTLDFGREKFAYAQAQAQKLDDKYSGVA